MQLTRPAFRLSVPEPFYEAVAVAVTQPFADSYLYGAHLSNGKLTPRTHTAYQALKFSSAFQKVAKQLQITLVEPTPWPGNGDRWSVTDEGYVRPKEGKKY